MSTRYFRKQKRATNQLGHQAGGFANRGADDGAAFFAFAGGAFGGTQTWNDGTPDAFTKSSFFDGGEGANPFLLKYSSSADRVLWVARWTVKGGAFTSNQMHVTALAALPDGGCIVTARINVAVASGMTLDVRNADDTIFKTFDQNAANPEDQIGVGGGNSHNGIIARYDSDGNVVWVKRFGHNLAAPNNAASDCEAGRPPSVDVSNNVVYIMWSTNFSSDAGQNATAGIGEAGQFSLTNSRSFTIVAGFALDDGTYTGEEYVNTQDGTASLRGPFAGTLIGGMLRQGQAGERFDTYRAGLDGGFNVLHDFGLATEVSYASPAGDPTFGSAFLSYRTAGNGAIDFIGSHYFTGGSPGFGPLVRDFIIGAGSNCFSIGEAGADSITSWPYATNVGGNVALPTPGGAAGERVFILQASKDGLSARGTWVVPVTSGATFRPPVFLGEESGNLLTGLIMPPAETIRYGDGEAGQTDVVIGVPAEQHVAMFNASNLDFVSVIRNTISGLAVNGSTPRNGGRRVRSTTRGLMSLLVEDTSRLDITGANIDPGVPAGDTQYGLLDFDMQNLSVNGYHKVATIDAVSAGVTGYQYFALDVA